MAKIKMTKSTGRVVAIVAVALALVMVIGGLAALGSRDTKTIGASAFSVGGLDETGKPNFSETSIYTKEAFECEGLRIVPDFEADLSYDVFYYDANGNLLAKKTGLVESFEQDYPLADTCRIVIHPNVPDDVKKGEFKIHFWEVYGYANQLTIIVDKDQVVYTSSPNLYDEEMTVSGTFEASDVKTIVENASLKTSSLISIDDKYDLYRVYIKTTGLSSGVSCNVAFADDDGQAIYVDDEAEVAEGIAYTFNADDMVSDTWYSVILEVPKTATHIRVSAPNDAEVRVYGITEK